MKNRTYFSIRENYMILAEMEVADMVKIKNCELLGDLKTIVTS